MSRIERAEPTCAFSVRLEQPLYDALYQLSIETGNSKNKILNIALRRYLSEEAQKQAS